MNNIFISKTKSFYNYITSTHCKDFKREWEDYYNRNESLFCEDLWFNFEKKKRKSLEKLYSVLKNDEFSTIKNYIFKEYPEEERFENWVKVLKNFSDFVYEFADPLIVKVKGISSTRDESTSVNMLKYTDDDFTFTIKFEKTKIKTGNSTLFDSITGLDRENALTFIKIEIINNFSGTIYLYSYMEDSSLNNTNGLDDDICDIQLEMIKAKLDKFIYNYIGAVFDTIVNYELKDKWKEFHIFNNEYIRNNYKELEEKWLETMNMESD